LRDVVIRIDRDLRITFVNPAWERLLGPAAANAVGSTIGEHVHEAERDDVLEEIGEVLSGTRQEVRRDVRFLANGTSRRLSLMLQPVHGYGSTVDGLAGTISPEPSE